MKLLFSEAAPDYAHYIFPYAIWAFPEPGETPADLFEAGFLPGTRALDRFYLARQVRVRLRDFQPSSENRRILRKCPGLTATLVPRDQFTLTPARRQFCLAYAQARFGPDTMPAERLDSLFTSPVATHLLVFADAATGAEAGYVVLYLEPPRVAYFYYSFYDLAHFQQSLGLFIMTTAVQHFAAAGFDFLCLGTCYSQRALYKTQFAGAEFFNGNHWSRDLRELKHLLARQDPPPPRHLLEDPDYLANFPQATPAQIAATHGWKLASPKHSGTV